MRFAVLPIVALGFTALFGCQEVEQQVACDASITYSVDVLIEDAGGAAIDATSVRYNVDGGTFRDCETYETGFYVCGEEASGDLTIEVDFEGDVQTMDFVISRDDCHVISQSATFVVGPTS